MSSDPNTVGPTQEARYRSRQFQIAEALDRDYDITRLRLENLLEGHTEDWAKTARQSLGQLATRHKKTKGQFLKARDLPKGTEEADLEATGALASVVRQLATELKKLLGTEKKAIAAQTQPQVQE